MKRFLKYDTEITKKENSPVDKNGLIKENIVGGGSSVQPDWNQLEESEPDFIKNKPFGLFKGKHMLDLKSLSLTFSDNAATASLNNATFVYDPGTTVKVRIQMSSNDFDHVYYDVPVTQCMYLNNLGGYGFTVGGDGYPFTISTDKITLDISVFSMQSVIYRVEIFDMNNIEHVLIDESYIPPNYVKVKTLPGSFNDDGSMLVYDYGAYSFVCRPYLTIKSSSGKKFKLVANDSGELSTEEITS